MIARYTRPAMGRIWSDQNKFQQWLEVELAAAEALAELGTVPAEAARLLRAHAGFDVARILEIEREVKHDVIAFTTAVAESMKQAGHAEASRWLHYGLTSNDVVDSAQALVLGQASALLLAGLQGLRVVLKRRALEFRRAVQIGRTHGVDQRVLIARESEVVTVHLLATGLINKHYSNIGLFCRGDGFFDIDLFINGSALNLMSSVLGQCPIFPTYYSFDIITNSVLLVTKQ